MIELDKLKLWNWSNDNKIKIEWVSDKPLLNDQHKKIQIKCNLWSKKEKRYSMIQWGQARIFEESNRSYSKNFLRANYSQKSNILTALHKSSVC